MLPSNPTEAELPKAPLSLHISIIPRITNSCSSSIKASGWKGNEDLIELCLQQSRAGADMDPPPVSCWSSAVPTDLPFPSFPEDGFAQGRFQLNPNTALCFQKSRSLRRGKGSRRTNSSSPVQDGGPGDAFSQFSPSGWSCFQSKPGEE